MTAGGPESILSMVIPALQMGVNSAQQQESYKNQQRQQRDKIRFQQRQLQDAAAAREADSRAQVEQIQQSQQMEAQRRREQLRRALASQRARFGAQGISAGGSSEAVLSGLAAEAEQRDAETRSLSRSRINRINDQLAYANRKSLLDLSQKQANNSYSLLNNTLGLLQTGLNRLPLTWG